MAGGTKRCPMCGEVKPRSEFYTRRWFDRRQQRVLTRISAYCRPCDIAYTNQRLGHRYCTDPAFRERKRQLARRWRARRREERAEDRRWLLQAAQRHLARLRAAGWNASQIARAIGVSRDSVYHWEHGEHSIMPEHLRALRALAEREANRDQDAA